MGGAAASFDLLSLGERATALQVDWGQLSQPTLRLGFRFDPERQVIHLVNPTDQAQDVWVLPWAGSRGHVTAVAVFHADGQEARELPEGVYQRMVDDLGLQSVDLG